MNESHPNHYSKAAALRTQDAKHMVRVCRECPVMAEDLMERRLAEERRRIWNRAIKTVEYYVGEKPVEPHPRQMEYSADYDSRRQEYFRQMDAYHHARNFVDILRERLALEEPPCEEAAKHQEFQDS